MMLQYEFDHMQDCITALFDCFEKVNISGQPLDELQKKLVQQNISFARKMVELSQKFEKLYDQVRQPTDSTAMEQQVHRLFAELCGQYRQGLTPVDMLRQISKIALKANKKDRIEPKQSKRSRRRSETENQQQVQKTSASQAKKGTISLKQAIQLKRQLQQQQEEIRSLFDTVTRFGSLFEMQFPPSDKLRYQKHFSDESQCVTDLLSPNIKNNSENIHRLKEGLSLIVAQAAKSSYRKYSDLYLQQIQKREQVFSYTVSRLLQSFRYLTRSIDSPSTQFSTQLSSIDELLNKLFELYPSAELLRDMEPISPDKKNGIQQYIANSKEVQVNLITSVKKDKEPPKELKKLQVELYRTLTRVNEWQHKVHENIKWKKQLQCKQLQKWLEELRHQINIKHDADQDTQKELTAFEEQLRIVSKRHEAEKQEWRLQSNKTVSKLQRAIKQRDSQIQQLLQNQQKLQAKHSKTLKKVEAQKRENVQLRQAYATMQYSLKEQQDKLEQLRSSFKSQQKENTKLNKIAKSQQQIGLKERQKLTQQLNEMRQHVKEKDTELNHERNIYRNKIRLMEQREHELTNDTDRLKSQLEMMIQDNKRLTDRLEQLGQLHEDKLREVEEIVQEYKRLQAQLTRKELEMGVLRTQLDETREQLHQTEQQTQGKDTDITRLQQQKLRHQEQAKKFKELGRLNEQDIQTLKEQIEKVKQAYYSAEEQLQQVQSAYEQLQTTAQQLQLRNDRLTQNAGHIQSELDHEKRQRRQSEETIELVHQEMRLKDKKIEQLQHNLDLFKEDRKELARLRKENIEVRNSLTTTELQLAAAKNDIQNISLLQQTTHGNEKKQLKGQLSRYQVELESLKVELKNRRESAERDRMTWEREKGIMQQKLNEMKILLSQKENLSNRLKLAKHYDSLQQHSNDS